MAYIEKIFGAPGTGKTHNLVKRLQEHLDKNCPFDKTLTISFTRVASRHIRGRISKKNKLGGKDRKEDKRCFFIKKEYFEEPEELDTKDMKGPEIPY